MTGSLARSNVGTPARAGSGWYRSHRRRPSACIRRLGLTVALLCATVGAACNDPVENPIKPEVVTSPVILSINIIGNATDGAAIQLTAFAQFSDGAIQDVTTQVIWASSNGGVASVNATAVVLAVGNGTVEISAFLEGVVGLFPLNVTGL